MAKRDKFNRTNYLKLSADYVRRRWPAEFNGKADHYICENCGFVHSNEKYFEIDHVLPCAQGGKANRFAPEDCDKLLAEDAENIELLYRLGDNGMVLCFGCNRAKWAHPFVPKGRGYAFESPYREMDCNPDHIYHGRPTLVKG